MTEAMEKIDGWLLGHGWRRGRPITADHCWHKQFTQAIPDCRCNHDQRGVQLTINGWDQGDRGPIFEIDLRAEPDDHVWMDFRAYAIQGSEFIDKLDAQCEKLLRAWSACQGG